MKLSKHWIPKCLHSSARFNGNSVATTTSLKKTVASKSIFKKNLSQRQSNMKTNDSFLHYFLCPLDIVQLKIRDNFVWRTSMCHTAFWLKTFEKTWAICVMSIDPNLAYSRVGLFCDPRIGTISSFTDLQVLKLFRFFQTSNCR